MRRCVDAKNKIPDQFRDDEKGAPRHWRKSEIPDQVRDDEKVSKFLLPLFPFRVIYPSEGLESPERR